MPTVELTWFFNHSTLGRVRATGFFTPGQSPTREDDGTSPDYLWTRFYVERQAEEDVTYIIDAEIDDHIERAGTSPLYDTIISAAVAAYKAECLIDELAEQELQELTDALEQADEWMRESMYPYADNEE